MYRSTLGSRVIMKKKKITTLQAGLACRGMPITTPQAGRVVCLVGLEGDAREGGRERACVLHRRRWVSEVAVQGSGFRVQGAGCRVQGAGFRVRVEASGFRVGGGLDYVRGPGLET